MTLDTVALSESGSSTDRSESGQPAAKTYEAPRLIPLGTSKTLIRGYWQQGQGDHGGNWYITGE